MTGRDAPLAKLECAITGDRADLCPDCGGLDIETTLLALDAEERATSPEEREIATAKLARLGTAPERYVRCGGLTLSGAMAEMLTEDGAA